METIQSLSQRGGPFVELDNLMPGSLFQHPKLRVFPVRRWQNRPDGWRVNDTIARLPDA